jgi:integrase
MVRHVARDIAGGMASDLHIELARSERPSTGAARFTGWTTRRRRVRAIRASADAEAYEVAATRLKRLRRTTALRAEVTRPVVRLTFRAAVRDVLDDYRMNRKRSLVDVERHVRLHLAPCFAGRRMAAITTADVRRYVVRRQSEGAKNATINRELSVLKRAFTLAIAAGTLASRPHITLLREDNVRRGFFETEEFEAVRRRLAPDLADFVSFLHITGWRWRSEAARLRWTAVAFGAGEVRLEPGTTKTGEGRIFPFTAELRALLERRRAVTHERERELGRLVPHVFSRANGKPLGSFNKAWTTACRAAGVPGRVLHDFRRTAVRNLLRAGVAERVAMQMVGWKSRQMLDRYHIVSAADLVEAARKLDAARA